MKDENVTRKVQSYEWPAWNPNVPITDREALLIARLIIDEKPRSYVEAARRLAQYVLDLNVQLGDIEEMEEILKNEKEEHDTLRQLQAAPAVLDSHE